jgi:anthranilate synthase component 1
MMLQVQPEEEGRAGIYRPSREEFRRLVRSHNLVSVTREVSADLETPVSAYLKMAEGDHSFLLESAERGNNWGRFSFLGCEPARVLLWNDGAFEENKGASEGSGSRYPLQRLFGELASIRPAPLPLSLPFAGGAVGFLGYDLLPLLEKVELKAERVLDLPEAAFMLTRRLAVFDHLLSRLFLVVNQDIPDRLTGGDADALYSRAVLELEEMASRLQRGLPRVPQPLYVNPRMDMGEVASNKTPEEFGRMVERAAEYIHAGEAFQVVVSQRLGLELSCDPFEAYRALRMENPSPYMFFLRFGEMCLVGSSPEPMVRRRGSEAVIRPIAGTRKRGLTPSEDLALEEELLADEKERAEHVMLVDLARNDLGRVCRPGSVKVTEMMQVERYSQVMHLVSEVRGELLPGIDNLSLLRASFPAGTVSGAPKIRACEIIDELEGERRGVYAGAVGYLDYRGDLDTCIAIRTLVAKGRRAWVQAGAGIVADSLPECEYQESMNKALAVLRAVRRAEISGGVSGR